LEGGKFTVRLRRLNKTGIQEFADFLDSLKENPLAEIPASLLTDERTSGEMAERVDIEKQRFRSRFEAAAYLDEKLSRSGLTDIERDAGLWSWLSLFYFDQLCPLDSSGKRKLHERAKLIPEASNYRKYYRHLLAGPYRIYKAHRDDPDRAMALLCEPISQPGDIVEQFASRQELVTNRVVMELVKTLYLDQESNRPRKGAAGKGKGSARRLTDILNQLDLTWDLHMMKVPDLLAMLPGEFDRFRMAMV
jgi:hypothetical protein